MQLHSSQLVKILLLLLVFPITGCALSQSKALHQADAQGHALDDARVIVGNNTATVYIPIIFLVSNNKNIAQGASVFGVRFNGVDVGLFNAWDCSVDIANDEGKIPFFDQLIEPPIDSMYDFSFSEFSTLSETERRIEQRLQQSCHLSVCVAKVSFDGQNIVMSELGPSLNQHSPRQVIVYLRLEDGTMLESIVDVEFNENIQGDAPGILLP